MTTNDDEDEEEITTHGRPNLYWQIRREVEEAVKAKEGDTFGGAFRGTPAPPHHGHSVPMPIGADDLCWCGEPFDHDWPGKAKGRAHPRGKDMKTTTEAPRIERHNLRAYHADLQQVIMDAVNSYGCRYSLRNNRILIYPPDGTGHISIAARNSERQVREARTWFIRHVLQLDENGRPTNPMIRDPEIVEEDYIERSVRTLARYLNDPREHPPKQEKPKEQPVAAQVAEPEPEPSSSEEPEWRPYVTREGKTNTSFETNGTLYRCMICLGTDSEYVRDHPRGIGGHMRAKHGTDLEEFRGPEVQAKRVEGRRYNALVEKVANAIEGLTEAVGYVHDTVDPEYVEELETENARLRAQCEQAEKVAKERDEALAKLALIREATGL